ncbi:MAG: histidinol-phosphatase HisJ [Eubacteriaceae bacterium]
MIRSNYHIHSLFCDGKNTLEEMVIAAIDAGLKSIGFTSHAPLPFKNTFTLKEELLEKYFQEIADLREKYASFIEIYCGLEIDYFYDRNSISQLSQELIPQLDYSIMSIHCIGSTYGKEVSYIDFTKEDFALGLEKYYDSNIKTFVNDYYQGVVSCVKNFKPTILGHFDLIRKYNQNNYFFDENEAWYRTIVKTCLDEIKKTNVIIEINTGAYLRVKNVGRYPSDWIISELYKRNIPITINGDSHSTEGIKTMFEETEKFLLECGFKEYWTLCKGNWEIATLGE